MLLILVVIRHLRAKYSSFFFISFFSLTQNPSSPLLCFLLFISVHWSPLSITAFFFFFFQLSSSTSSLLFYPLRSLPIIIGHQQHLHYLLLSTIVFISSVRAPHHHQFHLLLDVAIAMSGATQLVLSSPVYFLYSLRSTESSALTPSLLRHFCRCDLLSETWSPSASPVFLLQHQSRLQITRELSSSSCAISFLAWVFSACVVLGWQWTAFPFTGDPRWVLNPQSLISVVLYLASDLVEF